MYQMSVLLPGDDSDESFEVGCAVYALDLTREHHWCAYWQCLPTVVSPLSGFLPYNHSNNVETLRLTWKILLNRFMGYIACFRDSECETYLYKFWQAAE